MDLTKIMTQQEKRIKIAEVCGWTAIGYGYLEHCTGFGDNLLIGHRGGPAKAIPDYFNDLNAMHEAEKYLKRQQKLLYGQTLADIVGFNDDYYVERLEHNDRVYHFNSYCLLCIAQATAAQRAEAFGRALNLW